MGELWPLLLDVQVEDAPDIDDEWVSEYAKFLHTEKSNK